MLALSLKFPYEFPYDHVLYTYRACNHGLSDVVDASSLLEQLISSAFTVTHNLDKKAQLTQGLRATAVRVYRHLGFLKFQSCTINSAVPENPILEPNSTSIGKPVAKLWPFLYIPDGRQPPSWILSNRK